MRYKLKALKPPQDSSYEVEEDRRRAETRTEKPRERDADETREIENRAAKFPDAKSKYLEGVVFRGLGDRIWVASDSVQEVGFSSLELT